MYKTLFIKCLSLGVLAIFSLGTAQQVVKVDSISGTPLRIETDAKIADALENLEDNCSINTTAKTTRLLNTDNNTEPTATNKKTTVNKPTIHALSTADVCRQNPRIQGYKIQLVIVKSNQEANEVKVYFRSKFPRIKAETDASLRPNYKILAGSYFTKQSAGSDLAQIRKVFKSAIAIQSMIFCVEGK